MEHSLDVNPGRSEVDKMDLGRFLRLQNLEKSKLEFYAFMNRNNGSLIRFGILRWTNRNNP